MRKSLFSFLLGGVLLLAASTHLVAQQVGKAFKVIGDASMEPLMLLWLDDYRSRTPGFQLDTQFPGSTQGIAALIGGTTDIAPCSRLMTADERAAFATRYGYEPPKITVALDALVHIVHKNNPVKQFKIEELDAIWTVTRNQGWPKDIVTWGDMGVSGSEWSNRPIMLYGRTTGSGLRDYFVDVIELGGKAKTTIRRPGPDGASMAEAIISDQSGLTYGSISEVFTGTRAVPVVPKGGKAAIEPTRTTIADGSYPLVHPLYIYFNKSLQKPLDPALLSFLRYLLSPEGQRQVQSNDLITLPNDLLSLNQRALGR